MKIEIPDVWSGKRRRKRLNDVSMDYAIKKFNGNRGKVADWLGITKRCLYDRMKKRGMISDSWLVDKVRYALKEGIDIKDTKMWRYAPEAKKKEMLKILKALSTAQSSKKF